MIAEYHPHTVRSSAVPLYMQGFPRLDQIDTTFVDPGFTLVDTTPPFLAPQTDIPFFSASPTPIDTTMFDPTGGLVNTVPVVDSNTRDIANMYAGAVASGSMTPAQAANATAQAIAAAGAAAKPFAPSLGPGASPRVAVRPPGQAPAAASVLTRQSIPGVPNWALFALLGVGVLAMGRR